MTDCTCRKPPLVYRMNASRGGGGSAFGHRGEEHLLSVCGGSLLRGVWFGSLQPAPHAHLVRLGKSSRGCRQGRGRGARKSQRSGPHRAPGASRFGGQSRPSPRQACVAPPLGVPPSIPASALTLIRGQSKRFDGEEPPRPRSPWRRHTRAPDRSP